MSALPQAAALTRLLARADRVADLLPRLHSHLLEAAGGVTSVVLQPEPRSGILLATSGSHLDDLPLDRWLESGPERDAAARARSTGEPLVLADLAEGAPALHARLRAPHALIVPLGDAQQPQGIALLGVETPPALPAIRDAVLAVADAFVLALDRARLRREADLQRAMRDLLDEFSRSATSGATLAIALSDLCRGAARLFSAEHAAVWMHDRDARELTMVSASEAADGSTARALAVDRGVATAALRSNRSELVEAPRGGRQYVLAVPLRGRRRALGAFVIEGVHLAPGGSLDLVERAEEAGRQLSAALENLQLIEQVQRAHRELEDTFNSIPDLVLVCDTVLQVRQVNEALAARAGRPTRELPGTAASAFLGAASCALLQEVADRATPVVREIQDERLGGTFQAAVSPVRDSGERTVGIVLVARDVTEQVRLAHEREDLQHRLAQADKLAALGTFVAGIAHELNEPLQSVVSHLELLRATDTVPAPLQREVRHVQREAERAAKIVRNLLVFSGSRRLDRRRVAIATIVNRVASLRARSLKERGITLAREIPPDSPPISADALMLQQALLNVVLNAEQAVGEGGVISIGVRHAAGSLLLDVRDSGPGIPPDVLPHVFEPFFTTREAGAGAGLGLAIAYGIVQEHGGTLVADNHPAGGAVLTMTLPVEPSGNGPAPS